MSHKYATHHDLNRFVPSSTSEYTTCPRQEPLARGFSFDHPTTRSGFQDSIPSQSVQQNGGSSLFPSLAAQSFDTATATATSLSNGSRRRLFETSDYSHRCVGSNSSNSIFRRLASTESSHPNLESSSSDSRHMQSMMKLHCASYDSPTASPVPPQCNRRSRHSNFLEKKQEEPRTTGQDTEETVPDFQVPVRNLTDAFEQMAAPTEETNTPVPKQLSGLDEKEDSPTGVADLVDPSSPTTTPKQLSPHSPPYRWDGSDSHHKMDMPIFRLYPALQRDLTQPTVNRVSFYGVIHDINKEATGMAANDPKEEKEEKIPKEEECCALVMAVNGPPLMKHEEEKSDKGGNSMVNSAIIDEERWILAAIASRTPDEIRMRKRVGSSLAEAMGEQEPAGEGTQQSRLSSNPLSELASSRTQLWKPSRSWWEAKSGKNPWIEPLSHNKRWRFLWPLIHYHKFLARCIKKLKRNGVDVKTSVSPVPVFLREEVCAVSDHLAELSKFSSEEWMDALVHFHGWTEPGAEAQEKLRELVSRQKLRSLVEPADVQSPLLRDQIDEQFLRAMASQRDQMANGARQQGGKGGGKALFPQVGLMQEMPRQQQARGHFRPPYPPTDYGRMGAPYGAHYHPQYPPLPPQGGTRNRNNQKMGKNGSMQGKRNTRNHFDRYANGGRGYGWNRPPAYGGGGKPYGMYPHHYGHAPHSMYGDGHHGHYYPPNMHHPHQQQRPMDNGGHYDYYHGQSNGYAPPHGQHPEYPAAGWSHPLEDVNDPNLPPPYGTSHQQMPIYPPTPGTPVGPNAIAVPSSPQVLALNQQQLPPTPNVQSEVSGSQNDTSEVAHTPFKYHPQQQAAISPYWGHLDQATLAMTGLMTPLGKEAPVTPHRSAARHEQDRPSEGNRVSAFDNNGVKGNGHNAQPLLIPSAQYYCDHQFGAPGGNVPPSPATQFLMPPQGSWAPNQPHTNPSFFGHVPASPYRTGEHIEMMGQHLASIPDENAVSQSKAQNQSGQKDNSNKDMPPQPLVRTTTKMTATAESSEEGTCES
mmetsp:Transcript_28538/g.42377  ORF Transcript_28538/g.42377 Transcript_28538/m.42377 type:complete len:1032 (-) Transcript_28538:454-3549(-)